MIPPVTEGETLNLQIEKLTYGGEGLGRLNSFAIFVPRAVPGDEVQVKVKSVKKRYARAFPISWLKKSNDRIEPKCNYFDRCGGCHLQMLTDEKVREIKLEQLHETFTRLGPGELPIQNI